MSILNRLIQLFGTNDNQINWNQPSDKYTRTLQSNLTANRTYTLPDKDGTLSLGGSAGGVQLLGTLKGANLNTTSDQLISLSGGSTFLVTDVVMTNASTTPTIVAQANIYSATNKGGTEVSSSGANAVGALSSPSIFVSILTATLSSYVNQQSTVGSSLYLNVGTPQNAVCTCDIYVYGYIIA